MSMRVELTVPHTEAYTGVSEWAVRSDIGSKRVEALRRLTQWFISHDVLVTIENSYDSKAGQILSTL